MKRRVIAGILLSLHLAFVFLPELQIWQYLYLISGMEQSQVINFSKDDNHPLTGDIAYLSALIKRSGEDDEQENKTTDIPETTISHTGLIYLPVENLTETIISKELSSKYFYYATNLIFYPKKVNTPPPKVTFS